MWVICTGSEGFLGKYLMNRLIKDNVMAYGYDLINGQDVNNLATLEKSTRMFKPDTIVHLAGQVYLGPSLTHPQQDAKTNIIGTINILETARKHDANVVFASSGAVYGSNDRTNIQETHQPEPISPYGLSKLTAERYAIMYNELYNMRNIVFRFSSIYGTGRKKTSINLIWNLANKQKRWKTESNRPFPTINVYGDGSQTRDFTFVDDIVEALTMAINHKFPPDIYNVGTGTSTSINQLINLMESILGQKLLVEYKPAVMGDPQKNDFNIQKISRYGYKAKTSLEQGLQKLTT